MGQKMKGDFWKTRDFLSQNLRISSANVCAEEDEESERGGREPFLSLDCWVREQNEDLLLTCLKLCL